MPFTARFTVTPAIAAAIDRIAQARGSLDAAPLPAGRLAELQRQALAREAFHTTHIEGARLSFDQAQRLLAGEPVREAPSEDSQELLNYRAAFDLVGRHAGGGEPPTEALIREIHRRLVAGVRGDQAGPGRYRTVQTHLVSLATGEKVYTPPPAAKMRRQMAALVAWLRGPGGLDPVLVAGLAQIELVRIHPFLDGNGRTGRLLTMWCLLRAGYGMRGLLAVSELYDRDRPAYYAAIRLSNDEGADLTGWLEYFAAGLAEQIHQTLTSLTPS